MAKVIVRDLDSSKRGEGTAVVAARRVRDSDGETRLVHSVDAASETFGEDLGYIFKRNVAKARRENRKSAAAGKKAKR